MDSMVMDVRQRDLFIQALTDRLEEAQRREEGLLGDIRLLQEDVTHWRAKYDIEIRECNDVIRGLRRQLDDKECLVNALLSKRDSIGSDGGQRLLELLKEKNELLVRNADLEVSHASCRQTWRSGREPSD